ncbi:MAG: hypothetical protein IKY83_11440 [Proteobacteria bacterium]|nr:hypothetical protein [Pseudomonadota bacterium]
MSDSCALPSSLEVNQKIYQIVRLLGKGKGGYSYLARDGQAERVLKQIHHEPCSYYTFGNKLESELRDYARLKDIGIPMPVMLDVDLERERILKEYIPGPTVAELVAMGSIKQEYIKQVEDMCVKLYAHHINIDYYPTNFVLCDEKLYYIDYECNEYMETWDFEHWGKQYWLPSGS